MSRSLKTWMKIDRLFGPMYRLLHSVMTSFTSINGKDRDQVVIIKLFGMGSIIRLLDMCRERHVDLSTVTVITSLSNKELCDLWGLKAIFIQTDSIANLASGSLGAIKTVTRLRAKFIVDLERCSNLVGIFRTVMAWKAQCKTVSFELRNSNSPKAIVHSVENLSQEEIFSEGVKYLSTENGKDSTNAIAVNKGKVIININTSDLLDARRYDRQMFASAIRLIYAEYPNTKFYLTGVARERAYVDGLVAMLAGIPAHNVAGEWTFKRLVEELSNCELLVTGDSAPLHLGKYMNITTLSIWGPTQPAHFGYSPGGNFHPLSLSLDCSPCFLHPRSRPALACQGAITCMRQLRPETVAAAAMKLLSRSTDTREIYLPPNVRVPARQTVNAVR